MVVRFDFKDKVEKSNHTFKGIKVLYIIHVSIKKLK